MTRHMLIIGAQRCGTTYLHHLLDAHPQIAMARPARPEPKVFISEESSDRGLNWYHHTFFSHPRQEVLLGEKSTSYLDCGEAAARAARMLGTALIVVQLRDPIQRAISNWAFSTDAGLETRSLSTALTLNLDGPLPWDPAVTSVSPFAYLERGCYVDYLAPWFRQFGNDVIILFLEELVATPARISDLYARLGVDPRLAPRPPSAAVNRSHVADTLDVDLRTRIREYFHAPNSALAELLGRVPPWCHSADYVETNRP